MFFRSLLLGLWGALIPVSLSAQDVSLMSRDGNIEISGNFLSFDGEFYRVATDLGVLTVDASGVRCEGPGCPSLDDYFAQVRISGDPKATEVLLPALITGFASRNGYAVEVSALDFDLTRYVLVDAEQDLVVGEFLLSATSNAEGFAELISENADVVIASRAVSAEERSMARDAGLGDLTDPLRARVVALDALLPVVSRSNLIETLSLEDLAKIYSGEVSNWAELGGADAPIIAHLTQDDVREGSQFRHMIADTPISDSVVVSHKTHEAVVTAVEADPYAVGLGRLSVGGAVQKVGLTGSCGFAAEATPADIKTEDFPFTRPVFLYTPARRLPKLAREFLAFVVSPSAQLIVARTDFVDQDIESLSFRDQGRRFANAIARAGEEISLEDLQEITSRFQGAERLTLGFRFEDGSTKLDAQSRSNVHLLAELVEAGVFDGKALVFAGFSDGQGSASVNRSLSKRRANSVLSSLTRVLDAEFVAGRVTFTAEGYGEAMPLACDDVDWGRSLNRRVEVWVTDQR
ncbi:phosphate ABC transporter substrate-binding/OmpA family protein [Celeribacter litoreus]|uniref:phosphate ABC transporter substrate-binding/OmpA family protein n=1 Tax=Celeribacter litoreus TaxID=2876714 RepID=UPI001CCB216C|nr:phosphate ABC transporter substrate-binding/OmpA family protein [Celeribacter litoreus]MCA0042097.1 substrate-binding domain-containing protein [Celeribacter litoreus]